MPRPRRKPFWRWEPLPYLIVLVLLLITGSLRPETMPVAFWISATVTVAVILVFAALLVIQSRRPAPNPDASGDLSTLQGLALVDSAPSIDPRVPVADTGRHQAAIDASQARAAAAGGPVTAVLVPDASRWLALRLRVSVQLVADSRIQHGGFLPERAGERWQQELASLRERGVYLRVPAAVLGTARPFTVELDLGGLADAIQSAAAQQPSS